MRIRTNCPRIITESVEYRKGHKDSRGNDAPWCVVSHRTKKVLASYPTKGEAEKRLKEIQRFS